MSSVDHDLRDSTDRIPSPWLVDDLEDRPTLRVNPIPSIVRRAPTVLRPVDAVALEALITATETPEPANIVIAADVSAAFSTIVDPDDDLPTGEITTRGVRADLRAPAPGVDFRVPAEPRPEPARPRRAMRDDGAVPEARAFGAGLLQARGLPTPRPPMPAPVDSPAGSLVGAGMLQAHGRTGHGKLIVVLVLASLALAAAFLALR